MNVQFVSKGLPDQVSGGHVYNRYLLDFLRESGVGVTYHPNIPRLEVTEGADYVIVDSLAINEIAQELLSIPAPTILLLHVIPHGQDSDCNGLFKALCTKSRVIVTGNCTLESLQKIAPGAALDAVKIEPGVPDDWRCKTDYSATARRLLGVANYIPGKGVLRVLEVLEELQDLEWTLTLYGNTGLDPDHFRKIVSRIDSLGLSSRVEVFGSVSHKTINQEMLQADLLLHLSRYESYSMVTAEAIAARLPVLSTRVGNSEAFEKSGLVRYVESGGGSESSALNDLIGDPGIYGRLRPVGQWQKRSYRSVGAEFLAWIKSV